jgi:transglutaminase-like putative cysteine protease
MFRKLSFLLIFMILLLTASLPALASDLDSTVSEDETAGDESALTDISYEIYYEYSGTWTYTLIHEVVVTNNSKAVAFNVAVSVPLMDDNQPIYTTLIGEQCTTIPQEIITDEDGHRIATYTIPYIYGNQSVTLIQRYIVNASTLNYTFDRSNVADIYTDTELAALVGFMIQEDDVQSLDPAIISFTESAIGNITDPYLKARALFSAINLYLTYSSDQVAQDASTVLSRGTAYCQGYTNLYLACLRAAGIAARQQSGYLYLPQIHTTTEYVDPVNGRIYLNSLRHSWVEFFLPGIGWVAADPTFTYTYEINGSVQKFVDWSYFVNIDISRRYLFFREGSLDEESIDFTATGGDVDIDFNAYLLPGTHWTSFNDLDGHWAQSAVTYCVQNSLFNGVSTNTFAPDEPMTRAMFITVIGRLYKMLGGEIASEMAAGAYFTDVDPMAYYADYLAWAIENNLISGYGNGKFGPNDEVTREQMAKIITDFAQFMGANTSLYEGAYLNFADSSKISPWAQTGAAYCNGTEIITGMPGNLFSPGTIATRAQVATIIQRTALLLEK